MITLIWRSMPLIIAAVGAATAAWMIQEWRYGAQIASIQRVHADTLAQISRTATQQLQAQLELHQDQTNKVTQLDQKHYVELKNVQENTVRLAADLAATRQRLSVRVHSCSSSHMSTAAGAPRVDDGAQRAELYSEDAATLASITGDADRCAVKLTGLQAYVCSIKPDSPGCAVIGQLH
jgi:hypothetical protein